MTESFLTVLPAEAGHAAGHAAVHHEADIGRQPPVIPLHGEQGDPGAPLGARGFMPAPGHAPMRRDGQTSPSVLRCS